jgi:hypothetical protein
MNYLVSAITGLAVGLTRKVTKQAEYWELPKSFKVTCLLFLIAVRLAFHQQFLPFILFFLFSFFSILFLPSTHKVNN